MKKTAYYYLSLAAIVAGGLTSCQEDDMGYTSKEIALAKFEKDYQENFEREYGKIASGHTWGFSESEITRSASVPTYYKIVRQEGYIDLPGGGRDNFDVDPQCQQGQLDNEDKSFAGHFCPPAVSAEEKAYVFKWLKDNKDINWSTTCDMGSYFAQNLGQAPRNADNGSVAGIGFMNNLQIDAIHINDFNVGIGEDYYFTRSAISNPRYHDSQNDGNGGWRTDMYRFYYIPGYGYYLCFDYESYKGAGNNANKVEPDGIYNDWVIKLVPGKFDKHRVFCEDLGATLDLDFNDLVFDYTDYGDVLEINVLALLGTLPIQMSAGNQTETIKSGNELQPTVNETYYFKGTGISYSSLSISVETADQRGTCFIANQEGKAPYLLRVPVGTAWPEENQRIEHKYPDFYNFVTNPTERPDWWSKFEEYPDITPDDLK